MEFKSNKNTIILSNRLWLKRAVVLLLSLAILVSCKKDLADSLNQSKPSVYQYISENKDLGLYRIALKRAGLDNAETFSNGGPFTIFAPVDSALIKSGLTADSINRYDPQVLAMILKYGMVKGKISSSSLVGFYTADVTSLNTKYKPNLVKNYYGIFFNGVPLVQNGSIDLNDGVVHQLQKAALPPVGTLLEVVQKTPDLALLAVAIKALKLEAKYSSLGANSTYLTLLAPTNEAFKKFGYPDAASINADPSKLALILQVNTLNAPIRLFTSSFLGGYSFTGNYFYVEPDGLTIISIGNPTPVRMIRTNIVAANGALHVVDQVPTPFIF